MGRRLRQLPGLGEALTAAVSGYGGEEDRRKSKEAGFDRHLVKPLGRAVLEELDFSALAVLQQTKEGQAPAACAVRHLERQPLGTPYTEVCSHVQALFAQPPLAGTDLVVDRTGVGRPVLDMLVKARVRARLCPVTITGGQRAHREAAGKGW